MNKQEKIILLLFSIFLLVEFLLFNDLPFFWDAISKANRADWVLTHQFSSLIVPTEINSGHPPLWITSIAIFWAIFGKTIWSARLLLLLVNLGVFYQIFLLAKKSFKENISIYFVLLILIEPTLIAQTTSLNNDMLLLFFVLLGINSLFDNKQWLYTIAISGMLLTNLRGIYTSLALIIIHIWLVKSHLLDYNKKMLKAYFIGFGGFVAFLFYQYTELGWYLVTKNKNYSSHREVAGIMLFAKNSAAFLKNLLEYGRLVIWIPLGILVLNFLRKKIFLKENQSFRLLISLFVFSTIFFIGFVPFSNPMGPRYFLICYVLATILFINLLFVLEVSFVKKRILLIGACLAFLTGHFWIYPSTISQGWDSSLAYLNYYKQEELMLQYLKEEKISFSKIGTNIPLNAKENATLNPFEKVTPKFISLDVENNEFVLFSNIENQTDDDIINQLKISWTEVKTYSQLGVFITLYMNPKFNSQL